MEFNLGDEVEYTLAKKGAKLSAENIKKLPKGTVSPEVSIIPQINLLILVKINGS